MELAGDTSAAVIVGCGNLIEEDGRYVLVRKATPSARSSIRVVVASPLPG